MRKQRRLSKGKKALGDAVQLPFESFTDGMTQIELLGNREAVIEGSCDILSFDDSLIKVAVKKMNIAFYGAKLTLKNINSESVVVEGIISSVELIP